MKKLLISFSLLFISLAVLAQDPDADQLHETAKQFMRSGDWTNAVLVLNKALAKSPTDLSIQKDLALTYYYQRDFAKAKETIKPMIEREDADVQVYQIAGNVYKAIRESKDAEKMFKKALKKFPESGALYAEYGELLWMMSEAAASIEQWEAGIKADPSFAGNYYFASRYYFLTTDKVWGLLYGEIFVNMESYSSRTAEIKNMLLDGYKKFFSDDPKLKPAKTKNAFSEAFTAVMNQNSSVVNSGVTPESLIMLRTRFILDWNKQYAAKFPFRLFDHQTQLLQEGMFDVYNRWIFEAAGDLAKYEAWTKLNAEQYGDFTKFQKSKLFKIPAGQYYKTAN